MNRSAAWSLDRRAKEFGFVQRKNGKKTQTASAQMSTLLAQEEIRDVFTIFVNEFRLAELRRLEEHNKKSETKGRYRGPNQAKVVEQARIYVQDRSKREYRKWTRSPRWTSWEWYVWYIVMVAENLREKGNIWEDRKDDTTTDDMYRGALIS